MSTTPQRDSSSSIKVVARFRPQNKIEKQQGGDVIAKFSGNDTCSLEAKDVSGNFSFDQVFGMNSRQSDVFEYSIQSTVDDILNGYNGTVLAYGQTGSGKSYTMMGPSIEGSQRGIIPRIVEQIFASIMGSPAAIEYTVRVSYMEIYMERIKDLLQPQNDNLPIHEEKVKGVYVKGLSEIYVSSVDEVYDVMRQGAASRAVASTNMNQESSRSHSIFAVVVSQKNVETGSSKTGQLFLVDLAGSEKVGKTGASGIVLEEAKKINKSLSALGMVINALTDGKSTHIPYRDSKLTRILQESLGGNSRTTLIVNCSPSSYNDQETLSTLRFGVRAKYIRNKPKINAELSPAELKQLLKKAQSQNAACAQYISLLEKEICQWRTGETVPKDSWISLGTGITGKFNSTDVPSTPRPGIAADLLLPSDTPRPAPLENDEKEEFLKRENDLQDKLSDRETTIAELERYIAEKKEAEDKFTDRDDDLTVRNEKLQSEISELRKNIDRLQFERKETTVITDELKEINSDLMTELDGVGKQLLETQQLVREKSEKLEERLHRKQSKIKELTRGFEFFALQNGFEIPDSSSEDDDKTLLDGEKENNSRTRRDWIASTVNVLNKLETTDGGLLLEYASLRSYLNEVQLLIDRTEKILVGRIDEIETNFVFRQELDSSVKSLNETVTEAVKESADKSEKLDKFVMEKQHVLESLVVDANRDLSVAVKENKRLRKILAFDDVLIPRPNVGSSFASAELSPGSAAANSESPSTPGSAAVSGDGTNSTNSSAPSSPSKRDGKSLKQQISDFETVKRSLMRDLQNRCERVVELEISLDDARERYKSLAKAVSAAKGQQKRMTFLERNLEQLTQVQRALVDQNGQLKRELAADDRKLRARNERISGLEMLLKESQERLVVETQGFEARLGELMERIGDVKALSTEHIPTSAFSVVQGQRIVKPLRGGGGMSPGSSPLGRVSENRLDSSPISSPTRRTSWFTRS
ncbi:P-loop containing nucleoside triphosphate hydrolase protein [Lipomyces japonicus]|uniref:P-loop containing nucleoside triphosphate hydrolase protein n=1 Tax=Lipomyces japonicus TaxID=56871 RepID=UPI0034CE4D41